MMSVRFPSSGLYAVTPDAGAPPERLVQAVRAAIRGGAAAVQYRAKTAECRTETAQWLLDLCQAANVPLIINDDVDLAAEIGADGVHLGRYDCSLAKARHLLGPEPIIGISCYDSLGRANEAAAQGASYVAFGRFFESATKPDAAPARLETLREAKKILRIPIVAIGGVTPDNGKALLEAGADVLAAVGAIFGAADVELAARRFHTLCNPCRHLLR